MYSFAAMVNVTFSREQGACGQLGGHLIHTAQSAATCRHSPDVMAQLTTRCRGKGQSREAPFNGRRKHDGSVCFLSTAISSLGPQPRRLPDARLPLVAALNIEFFAHVDRSWERKIPQEGFSPPSQPQLRPIPGKRRGHDPSSPGSSARSGWRCANTT